jgi:glutamyl-tRNA reductase
MKKYHISKYQSFYCIGLNYNKADATIRGKFSLNPDQVIDLLAAAKKMHTDGLLVISTCNRTELFGFAEHPFQLINLLCSHSNGTVEEFRDVAYVHKNQEAISHLFKVGTGLDSQILGDFEIIAQLKTAFAQSKKVGLANPFLERLCNSVIQASKRIKTETEISSGATSVSFASVQYILNNVEDISNKSLLLFGTGKIGRNTCENLIKHTDNSHITLINRTKDKAEKIAGKFNLIVKDYGDLSAEIRNTDVLIVATGANRPTISKALIYNKKPLLILDLSIPRNVDENVTQCEGVSLVHLDELSQITDQTLNDRKKQLPRAEQIIEEVKQEFNQWLETRRYAPVIKALKDKLILMQEEELDFHTKKNNNAKVDEAKEISDRIIQKITKHFAEHFKDSDTNPSQSLEVITKVFQLKQTTHD